MVLIISNLAQSGSSVKLSGDEDSAAKAADELIARFRETLDMGIVFDDLASTKARENLQKGLFSLGEVDQKFLRHQDSNVRKRLFKDEMNYYYIKMAFYLTFSRNIGDKEKEDLYAPNEFSVEFTNKVRKFRCVKGFFDDRNPQDDHQIKTDDELSKYLAELEQVTVILKKYLPRNYSKLKIYKTNYDDFVNDQDKYLRPKVESRRGNSYFEVSENEDVFVVIRDIFTMYFIKENGKMKLLGFGIGN
jgi:hypothetical protein